MDFLPIAKASNPQRTRSVPGSATRAVYRQSVPRALTDALCAARERFERFRHTKLAETTDVRLNPSALGEEKEVKNETANGVRTEPVSTPIDNAAAAASSSSRSPMPQVPAARCFAFDTAETMRAMRELRHVKDCCPEKISTFLTKLRACLESEAADATRAGSTGASAGGAGHSTTDSVHKPRSGNPFALLHQPNPSAVLRGQWEDRLEAPIAVSSSIGRKRGLFGVAERKELHHLVISILNRVSNDENKYRDVKNELLRLPIPEANDAMLEKIVDVFFQKAVREQHFSNSYADLVTALCKVPEGQRIVGDKSQSIEYRLRQQLLKRCQVEFQQLDQLSVELAARGGEDRNSDGAEEAFKERRDRTCGIIRFVGELFNRQIVTENVIEDILLSTSTGRGGSLQIPPTYTPTESQMDETITLLNIVDSAFFKTKVGSAMLLDYTNVMQYWSTHHPVVRIKFLLLSVVERLGRLVEEQSAALKEQQQHQQQQQQQQQQQTEASAVLSQPVAVLQQTHPLASAQPSSLCSEDARSESFNSTDRRPPTAHSSEVPSPLNRVSVFVGGKPIPAPRSAASRNGSTSMNSNYPLLSNPAVLQVATTESVAKYMKNITSLGRSIEEVTMEITMSHVSVIPVAELWTERCLTVVKADKDRAVYGAFLSSLNATAHSKGTLREELRKTAVNAFNNAVKQKLYEDLRIFRYWVRMICSDSKREVLDEDLLNESLAYLLINDPGAVKPYLRDVAHELQMTMEKYRASNESSNFVRYRPLHVIHCHNTRREQGYELRMVNFAEVRAKSIEINVFCALMSGNPPKEELFEYVRSYVPRSTALVAPEVLSAILHAELCSNTADFLEDNSPLLHLAGDGPDRETREILLVAELYASLKDIPEGPRSASVISRVMAKLETHLISGETKLRAQRYFQSREEYAHLFVGAHVPHVAIQARANTSNSNSNPQNGVGIRRHTSQRR